jgi:TRAP-type C4-dicarboxylate transport system permease small subunit
MRRVLDVAISTAAVLACLLLVTMVVATFATIVLRPLGVLISGHEEIATFAMVGMAFLGLPYAYRTGAHIRVETLLNRLPMRARARMDIWCVLAALVICGAFSYFAFWLVLDSYVFGDISEGLLSIPRWIPQLPILLGLVLFALALIDDLVMLSQGGKLSFEAAAQEQSVTQAE